MPQTYRELYFELMFRLGQAVDAFDRGELIRTRQLMIAALRAGEEAHLEADILVDR